MIPSACKPVKETSGADTGFPTRGGGGGLLTSWGGGGGAVHFRPIKRAGGRGVLSDCVQKARFLDKRGGCKPHPLL